MLIELATNAKEAARVLAASGTAKKNSALLAISRALVENTEYILAENKKDLEEAQKNGMKPAMCDRLMLDSGRISAMAEGIEKVISLDDPVGKADSLNVRPNGLEIKKVRVPLGVIAIIYEARPNVTVDAAALCIKSGNATVLRGGSEAINSNLALVKVMKEALLPFGLSEAVQIVSDTSRETASELMRLNGYIDVLIPRGGAGLIRSVVENATVPVIETGSGNCHIYVEESADIDMAVNIIVNAKVSRPSVCNAAEGLLIDEKIADSALPRILSALAEKNVEIRGCEKVCKIFDKTVLATDDDWATEYNDYIMHVKVVKDISEAVEHINRYGTGHSEAIITNDYAKSREFTSGVDAAAVYVNASTRFTDGFEFGFGAEIGISTQKMHARGPMGLSELTSSKYIISGNGQIR